MSDRTARRGRALLVALVLSAALAGCGAIDGGESPTATDTGTATPAGDAAQLRAAGVDPAATFDRIERLLGVNATQPSIDVVDTPPRPQRSRTATLSVLFGEAPLGNRTVRMLYDAREHRVVVPERTLDQFDPAFVEATLAHEYAHALQYRTFTVEALAFHSQTARTAFVEGTANWAGAQYVQRYDHLSAAAAAPEGADVDENRTLVRLATAPDALGRQWANRTLDDPGNFSSLFDRPPETTAAFRPGVDGEPRPLSVAAGARLFGNWTWSEARPKGDLWTRIALADQIDAERAATVADGWGADALRVFERGDAEAVVWVHRWNSTAAADEGAAALRDFAAGRRAESDAYRFRAVRVTDDATALVAGDPAATDLLAVTGSGSDVTVRRAH